MERSGTGREPTGDQTWQPADQVAAAAEHGRICAAATDCLRDLQDCATAYPDLFPARPFGPTVFSGVALANAFGSPWAPAEGIRIAARTALWAFAADWLVDYMAGSAAEVDALVTGCAAVGDGADPDPAVPLQLFLASLRDDLAARPGWAELRPVWREHLGRYLDANAREWGWQAAKVTPTLEDYLGNADNFGSSLVNVSHWIWHGTVATVPELTELATASAAVQRTLRLLNDEVTYERDRTWGDLNALMLGLSREDVARRIGELVRDSHKLIEPFAATLPREAAYLERQIGFSTGYYGLTDYWGEL